MWQKNLNVCFSKSFKKIRIKKKNFKATNKEVAKLIDKRNSLTNLDIPLQDKSLIDSINNQIATIEAEENINIIMKNVKTNSDDPENMNMSQMWKLL